MAEQEKTTTRGRKPKTEVVENVNTQQEDMVKMMTQMQEQIAQLQKQLNDSNKQVEKADKEKDDLTKLVEALKATNGKQEKNLPKKVKLISLIPNKYNLTTQENGKGKQFTFNDFGDLITMKTSELEEILSIQDYRKQAEEGFFYILDVNIVEDQDLTDSYKNISDKNTIENVMKLKSDECVDIFCGLSKELQDSLASRMAEMLNDGHRLDRNRLKDISMKADIDIEKLAESFSKNKRK